MKKQIPIGLSDYKILIDENYYYVDKTLLIDDILKYGGRAALLPRPRRFGKTLNLSMLQYFFEKTDSSNAYLFEDKKIWQLPERAALQGKFPVIFLTLRDIKEKTWQKAKERLIEVIATEYERHSYILNSDQLSDKQKKIYKQIIDETASDAHFKVSLKKLSEFLYRIHKVRPVVLLDEYDAPIYAGFLNNYYSDVVLFVRDLMSGVFKDNKYLERGIITGILRTAREDIFSGLNNLKVFTLLDDQISDKFGFTEHEVEQLLQDYDLPNISQKFKDWYNGYAIGTIKIYNPWSVLSCVSNNGELLPYWVNTSDNALVYNIISQSDSYFKDACADLIAGKAIQNIKIENNITLPGMMKRDHSIWTLLFFSGYITSQSRRIVEGEIRANVVLPNKELQILFKQFVDDLFRESLNNAQIIELYHALINADGKAFEALFSTFVTQSMSAYDISTNEPEMGPPLQHSEDGDKKSYHLFALGLFVVFADQYMVVSNRESGHGRFDIMLIPKEKSNPGIIIEFKKLNVIRRNFSEGGLGKNETMSECADRAIEQIKERNYAAQLVQQGVKKIVAFGIALHKKEVLLKQEELTAQSAETLV